MVEGLNAEVSSVRLRAVMAAGTSADPGLLEVLVARCAVEPDFFVRDMLTWALTRLPAEITVPRLRVELGSESAQARGQALHTLSKIGDRSVYEAVGPRLLHDGDDEVARTAWRTAVALAPESERAALARELAVELGRGDRARRLSLSRALVGLGEVIEPVLAGARESADPAVREHAAATEVLLRDPEAGFDAAVHEASRMVALGPGVPGADR
ncbi:HEAT repeat domain-containing protein [Actinoplanes sp. NPDC049802]|uniref:HEAT repeat domain-containing protein n=1 Tax=Actinoplanes sp. NPDC049802 TaxID=3154742 RepID=UPI0033EF46CD